MAIDINNNREEIFNQLSKLDSTTQPLFGKMSPQHVVEHLAVSVSISNGKGPQKQFTEPDEGNAIKEKLIYTDMELPNGVKTPILGDEPPALKCVDMNEAISQLKSELESFDSYFKENPNGKTIHPRMGPLSQQEWTILHGKHIAHHLKQFGLK